MNARILRLFAPLFWAQVALAQISFGSAHLINDHWSFALRDDSQARQPHYDDGTWEQLDLPHDWSVKQAMKADLASCTGYLPGGIGWYRKKLVIPEEAGGEKVYLYFEGVYNHSEVYLNGQLLGKRPNGYVSFYYDATPYVQFDQENTIAVRVDHSRYADSRWYTGSGIYRNVYIVRAGSLHLAPWGVFVEPQNVSVKSVRLRLSTELQNQTSAHAKAFVKHELLSADGKRVGTTSAEIQIAPESNGVCEAALDVSSPHLWSLDDPYLYTVRTTVTVNGQQVDQTSTRTGLRGLSVDADTGFALNGSPLKIKGVCIHHEAGVLGAAVPPEVWRNRLQTLKSLGCNALRFSHNPQAPVLYDLCDELGLLVMDEAFDEWEYPKRKWIRGWNVGEPGYQGSYEFFDAWSDRDVADMVRRDRNHPCVFAWSIGNEIDYPNDPYSHSVLDQARINQPMLPGYKPAQPDSKRMGPIAQRLVADVKQYDRSRPVTAALAGVVMSNETDYPAALDVVGYNYTEERYPIDHEKYPRRILYGSENGHSLKAWKAVADNGYIFGQFLWTGIDYLGEAGPWPARGSTAGLLDLTGAVKPRGRYREALWSNKPVVFLGTQLATADKRSVIDAWPVWNYEPGVPIRVLCYTNAVSARLTLNGQPVGGGGKKDETTGVIFWELPYQAGKLDVVALDGRGTEIGHTSLVSAESPESMKVTCDETSLARDHGVTTVSLQLVDHNGVLCMGEDREVTCRIEGPARLLGLEAGNNRDVSDSTDATHRVYHGRIVAYVQSTGGEAPIHVRFESAHLPEASITLATR